MSRQHPHHQQHVASAEEAPSGWVSAVERIAQLEAALESRSVIARAQGILMERYDIDEDAAIAVLKRSSSDLNLKVRVVADILIETRQLPRSVDEAQPRSGSGDHGEERGCDQTGRTGT